jgi:hypothetical protein
MSDETPRRSKNQDESKIPTGYRSSRRGSKSLKAAKRAERADQLVTGWNRFWATTRNIGFVIAMGLTALVALAIVALLVTTLINGIARWSAHRKVVASTPAMSEEERRARENLLVIGVENGKAVGFLAMRVDSAGKQVFGVAIPDGAFIEVPGQGYERVGESFSAGPDVSLAAISNYLTVPFRSYVTVSGQVYRDLLTTQQIAAVSSAIQTTNLTDEQRAQLTAALADVPLKSTAFVPLPVKPIKLGSQTYYEPQRAEVADLLSAWWGINPNQTSQVPRVIVYNGAGKPGIAGDAAQRLIRGGFRVVDTKNADRFDYKTTIVVVQRGPLDKGAQIVSLLGAGVVKEKRTDQDVADLIVIIGRDYKPLK